MSVDAFDFGYPPLDISAVSRALANIWRESMDRLERENGSRIYIPIREEGHVYQRIVELLKAYDEGRTRQIKYLIEELVRLHSVMVSPPIILSKPL